MNSFRFYTRLSVDEEKGAVVLPPGIETKAELLRFLKSAVPLPEYFGNNWDAWEECLADLDWLPEKKLVLIHHDIPMTQSPSGQRTYLKILRQAAGINPHLEILFPEKTRSSIEAVVSGA